MQLSHLLLFEDFGDVVTLKQKKFDGIYQRFAIYAGKRVVGEIEVHHNRGNIDISSIVVKEANRAKGYGVKALKELMYFYADDRIKLVFADCVSKQSLNTFCKAYGQPEYMGDDFNEYESLADALEQLPDVADFDEDGTMSASGAIQIRYEFSDLFRHLMKSY